MVATYESWNCNCRLCHALDPELEAVDQSVAAVCVNRTILLERKQIKNTKQNDKIFFDKNFKILKIQNYYVKSLKCGF